MAAVDVLTEGREGESPNLVLYYVVPAPMADGIEEDGWVKLNGQDYIGLRQEVSDAIDRAKMPCNYGPMEKAEIAVFKFTFTPTGVSHYTLRTTQGAKHGAVSVLRRQAYPYSVIDWKVWHFTGDLPLYMMDECGRLLLYSERMYIY